MQKTHAKYAAQTILRGCGCWLTALINQREVSQAFFLRKRPEYKAGFKRSSTGDGFEMNMHIKPPCGCGGIYIMQTPYDLAFGTNPLALPTGIVTI